MEIKLVKWGNSYGLRLPKAFVKELDLKENDPLSVDIKGKEIIIKKNAYDEMNIKKVAEEYYGKSFIKLKNIVSEKELEWSDSKGEEVW